MDFPAKNPVYRSKSMKNPNCTRTLPVPVGPCRTGHSASTGQTARSDRSDRLVPILAVNRHLHISFRIGSLKTKRNEASTSELDVFVNQSER